MRNTLRKTMLSSTGKLLLPSVLTIPYDPAVLENGEDETDIFAAYLDGTVWIKANGTLNADSDRITLETNRLDFVDCVLRQFI